VPLLSWHVFTLEEVCYDVNGLHRWSSHVPWHACVASHDLYHYFIAREGPSSFPTCLLASCTWIEELVGGLTPHTRGSNYLYMM
jgi:hypothetical protein